MNERAYDQLAATTSAPVPSLESYRFSWPMEELSASSRWQVSDDDRYFLREMPETLVELRSNSQWPAFFPAPMSIISTSDGSTLAIEREVGASIVNRFPYVVAVSFCRSDLSPRHHPRKKFMNMLERSKMACVQFIEPGANLDAALKAISDIPDEDCQDRPRLSGLDFASSSTINVPFIADSYLVYETRLVKPQRDFAGDAIYSEPWIDVGSHRIYFLEITAIRLRSDIAKGTAQINWRALPTWTPEHGSNLLSKTNRVVHSRYQKGYTPEYKFPAKNTIAFEADEQVDGMAIKYLPPLPEDQVEVDNDRARWPCFFPSSCGLITSWTSNGTPNIMPCGSTTVVSRSPFIISPCISYANINVRYAARSSLENIRKSGTFGCSVPYVDEKMVDSIKYLGNTSLSDDIDKVINSGLNVRHSSCGPVVEDAPIHFDCKVRGEVKLGTHIMFFGEVSRIWVRKDVRPDNPLNWYGWPGLSC